jgi:lysophospholipase L1-like esterase
MIAPEVERYNSPWAMAQIREVNNPPVRLRQPQPLRIIAMGDSTIYGYGDPEGGGWVERLRRLWMMSDQTGHALYNLGVRGDRVQQVTQRLEVEFRHRGELRHRVPDLIILSVGINDSARLGRSNGRNFTDFEQFQVHLSELLDQARQLCPVLFVGMTPVNEGKMPFSDCLYYNHADQHRYKEATHIACEQRQIPYLDVFSHWLAQGQTWWRSRLCDDGLHPNSLGYAALMEQFLTWDCGITWD